MRALSAFGVRGGVHGRATTYGRRGRGRPVSPSLRVPPQLGRAEIQRAREVEQLLIAQVAAAGFDQRETLLADPCRTRNITHAALLAHADTTHGVAERNQVRVQLTRRHPSHPLPLAAILAVLVQLVADVLLLLGVLVLVGQLL